MSRYTLVHRYVLAICTIAVGISMLGSAASAQTGTTADTLKPRFSLGSAQTVVGFVRMRSSELDTRLGAAGLPKAATSAATIGFGADVRMQRLLVGASWQSMLTRNQTDAAYRTRMAGNYALFDVGFAAVNSKRLSVYPIAGLGATRLSLSVKERGDFTFDDGLGRPGRELSMAGNSGLMHAGLLVEQRFQRRSGAQYALSVRAGVTRSIGAQSWQSDESRVQNGPSGIRGSYVRIGFSKPLHNRRDAALPMAATVLQTALR